MDGYEDGYKHGETARTEFIAFTKNQPNSYSDFTWFNKEREKQKLINLFNDDSDKQKITMDLLKDNYFYLTDLISKNLIYRALNDSIKIFYEIKNYHGYNISNLLFERLKNNMSSKAKHKITNDESSTEFSAIVSSFKRLIEEEFKTIIDSYEKYNNSSKNKINKDIYSNNSLNANDFVLANDNLIQHLLIENWKIPKTIAPGLYSETYNRIIKWFDNIKKSEYPLALLILQNRIRGFLGGKRIVKFAA